MLGYWIAMQVFMGIQNFGADGGGVAYWAHAGGFLAGVIFTTLLFGIPKLTKKI